MNKIQSNKNMTKRKRNISIYAAILCLSITLIFVTWILSQSVRKKITNIIEIQQIEQQENLQKQLADNLSSEINHLESQLYTITEIEAIKYGNTDQCNQTLRSLMDDNLTNVNNLERVNSNEIFDCGVISSVIGVDAHRYDYIDQIFQNPDEPSILSRAVKFEYQDHSRYITTMHVPIYDDNGNFKGTLGGSIYLDKLDENYITQIEENSQGTVYLIDDNGDILHHEKHNNIGLSIYETTDPILSDSFMIETINQALDRNSGNRIMTIDGKKYIVIYEIVNLDPDRFWVILSVTPYDKIDSLMYPIANTAPYVIFSLVLALVMFSSTIIYLEIRKNQTEGIAIQLAKFEKVVENASDAILITDEDGKILYGNKSVENITEFPKEEFLNRKAGTKELWGGLMNKEYYKKLWNTVKKQKRLFKSVIKNKKKSGIQYDSDIRISPVIDESGNIEYFVVLERDITKEKMIDQAKTEFVSLASHQLKTPLTGITWNLESLLNDDAGKLNKQQKNILSSLYESTNSLTKLVNALLNVSRIDLGTVAINPEPTNLEEIVNKVLKDLESRISKKELQITNHFEKELPLINVDPTLIRIVIENVISNATKYTPDKGSVEIFLKKEPHYIKLIVKDTGLGIPEDEKPKIFTKLYRADNVVSTNISGTGLGLYITKKIVEASKGKIYFESKEGKGTTFFIDIPLKGMTRREGTKGLIC
ncbi:PAS domain S-box protein [Candidatus Dojkabacteria bacterium]|nr:PAS domain S-box protein [Candidatus Dojkabacteria bacterium]